MTSINVKNNTNCIVGVGSALVDILLQESDDFITTTNSQKGGMVLVDAARIDQLLDLSRKRVSKVPGGSACNTIIGIGQLGAQARFIGKRGNDSYGETLERALKANNVEPILDISKTSTGRVLSIITPDAQRSMFTFLGAAAECQPSEIIPEKFLQATIAHIEGYLLFNEKLIFTALESAKKAGALISLDLASFTVVETAQKILHDLVAQYVDIILANEDEAKAYTGVSDEQEALTRLNQNTSIAVLKVGKRGSFIAQGDKRYQIGICGSGDAVDTTGAGDLWAAGFLYGLLQGFPLEKCGKIGAACGYEVCQVIGAHIPEDGWKRIKKLI